MEGLLSTGPLPSTLCPYRLAWADFLSGGVSIYQQDEEKEGMEEEELQERDEEDGEELEEEEDGDRLPLTPLPHNTHMFPPTTSK